VNTKKEKSHIFPDWCDKEGGRALYPRPKGGALREGEGAHFLNDRREKNKEGPLVKRESCENFVKEVAI